MLLNASVVSKDIKDTKHCNIMKTLWIHMTDDGNHLSTMKNGSHWEQSRVIKISCREMDGNVSSCHPKVVQGCRPCREPSQSPPVKSDRQGDKTNYVDGDMWLTECRLTDRYMGTGKKNTAAE